MNNPRDSWEKIETEEPVVIPTADRQGVAETINVKVPAFRDPKTGEIYLDGVAIRMLDDVKARHLGRSRTVGVESSRRTIDSP
jgi:hypothetical protein